MTEIRFIYKTQGQVPNFLTVTQHRRSLGRTT